MIEGYAFNSIIHIITMGVLYKNLHLGFQILNMRLRILYVNELPISENVTNVSIIELTLVI